MLLPSCYCVHDDYWFLESSIDSLQTVGPVICFVSKRAWNGSEGCWERAVEVAEKAGAEVVLGDWPDESLHRRTALAEMKRRGYKHIFIPDGDEVPEPKLIEALVKIAKEDLADVVRVRMDTYWRDAEHVIRPREELAPILLLDCQKSVHQHIREYSGERVLLLGPEYGVLHHLSYAGPDERIERKISTWGHRHEVAKEWFNRSWKGWEADPLLRDLHPTHPHVYGSVERIEKPEILAKVPNWREEKVEPKKNWPKVSVVIPLHGGPEDIAQCLDSLAKLQDLIHETIVVDDVSADNAAEVASMYDFVTLLKNETNLGFAATCNKGFEASTGSVILFLNSDTIVPKAGLIRLIESLMESGTIGAAGPLSNNVGYHQRIDPTYTSLDNLGSFAEDLALSERQDRDVEMLVGFALAVRRSVLEEVGLFDERFGRGMFEDTDLCYRLSRAGYRLRLANRAYVHHWGSRSLTRSVQNPEELLHKNGQAYRAKWQRELETGYASHLPGFGMGQGIPKFNPDRHPDKLGAEIARLKKQAMISLCMIVKNEERVLGACLESAKPFFGQMIVVDTGSTDRTVEIAKEHGAEVYEIPWPDSFAEARNESMKYAKGDWIFWMDADDTLPFETGEQILQAALSKQADAFVIPVQFMDNGVARGTSVDHVKLFRNLPGLRWKRRIHEQILSQLTARDIIPARLKVAVNHTHYDSTPEGQAKKRLRDMQLLNFEYEEDPNDPFTLFNLGMTENHAGNFAEAIRWFTKALENATPQMTHTRKIYALLAQSLKNSGQLDQALEVIGNGLGHYPEDPELHFQAAIVLKELGRFQEAIEHLRSYGEDNSDHYSSIDTGILTYRRWTLLGDLSAELGNFADALKWYGVCIEREQWFTLASTGLFDISLKVHNLRYANFALDSLYKVSGPSPEWAQRVRNLAEATSGTQGIIPALGQLVEQHPVSPEPRLTLVRELLAQGHSHVAVPHLELLEIRGVAEAAFLLSVLSESQSDLVRSLRFARRAVELNPGHQESGQRMTALEEATAQPKESVLPEGERVRLLTGPHAGQLGAGSHGTAVVIVTFNSGGYLKACLDSVLATVSPGDEVIVVDNNSTDDTIEIARTYPKVGIFPNAENVGYSRAANIGILRSTRKHVVLLNPDTVVYPGWLSAMGNQLSETVGVVGPLSDAIAGDQFVGHYLPQGYRPDADGLAAFTARSMAGRGMQTKLVMGVCMMFDRSTLDTVGLLDENLILGADDLEMCWRIAMLGYTCNVALDAFVHHKGHASFETLPTESTSGLIEKSDAALVSKLAAYYGSSLPSSSQLWNCDIFDSALAEKLIC